MKKLAKMLAILGAFAAINSYAATPSPFSGIASFGDSLSDVGNGEDAPFTVPGGLLWINYLAADLGLTIAPSTEGGTDYAYAGALTGPLTGGTLPTEFSDEVASDNATTPSVLAQISTYLSDTGGQADPAALYTVWGGANDLKTGLIFASGQDYSTEESQNFAASLVGASVGNIYTGVNELHNAGANYILVPNLPDLGNTPELSEQNFVYSKIIYPTVLTQLIAGVTPIVGSAAAPTVAGVIIAHLYQNPTATASQISSWLQLTFALSAPVANVLALQLLPAQAALASSAATASALSVSANSIAEAYNNQLLASLNGTGFKIIQIDVAGLLNAIQNNYARFGFVGPDSSYTYYTINASGVPVSHTSPGSPNQYIFYDGWHPTPATGEIAADYILSVLEGPTFAAALAQAPFAVADNQNSNIQSELLMLQTGVATVPVCQFNAFVSGITNPGSVSEDGFSQPGYTTDNNAFTVGTQYRFNQNGLAGVAVGRSMGDVEFAHNAGSFDLDENMVTAFGGYTIDNIFANAELTYGNIDYSNIKRNFALGILPETVTGNTTGDHYAADGMLGYNLFTTENLKTGPIVTADYQKIIVAPYAEMSSNFEGPNGAFDALQYEKQTNDSFVGGIGWQASYNIHISNFQLLPFLQATYDHQMIDQDRTVSAGVTTLPGSIFSIPVTAPDGSFGIINAGIQGIFSYGIAVTLGYNAEVGQTDETFQSVGISASMPL